MAVALLNDQRSVKVTCVDATVLFPKNLSFVTEKLFVLESSDATATLLKNVVKLIVPLLVATLQPNTATNTLKTVKILLQF